MDARVGQQIAHPVARPLRIRDEIPANGIGYARQRHDLFDGLEPVQILEAVGDFAVHHAVNLQLPVRAAQLRHAQRRVDPVEVVVAGDE
jgi:hypothetical protein